MEVKIIEEHHLERCSILGGGGGGGGEEALALTFSAILSTWGSKSFLPDLTFCSAHHICCVLPFIK